MKKVIGQCFYIPKKPPAIFYLCPAMEHTQRYFMELAYDGTDYHGWQRQPEAISVQQVLEEGLCKMLRCEMRVTAAGRTDTGVHATQMFIHFNYEEDLDLVYLVYRLNRWLPQSISVFEVFPVTANGHARFNALSRSYEYHFQLRPDPFKNKYSFVLYREPDFALMQEAAQVLLAYTDFQCFSRVKTDVKTYLCTVTEARFEHKDHAVIFHVSANRFLRNMVRAIVGTLLDIGYGKTSVAQLHDIIASKNRNMAGASAPARGLYLTKVEYPQQLFSSKINV